MELGAKLRQYRIESILGQGGFGITYLATDEDLERKVAIKECFPRDFVSRTNTQVVPTSSNQKNFDWALSKFLDEATTLAKFKHDGIVQVLQIIKDENNTAYMVLEFLDGQPLDKWLRSLNGKPSQRQLQDILQPILQALEVVHRNHYTHRDIAPDNIYIRANGKSVLLDFGAAKLSLRHHSKTLNLVIKEGYSPPEQYYSEGRSGPWTDIYSLSATLYRAITGSPPVEAAARTDAINNDEPDPLLKLTEMDLPEYSPAFLRAIDDGLAPQIKMRPQSINDWAPRLLDPDNGQHPEIDNKPVAAKPTANSTRKPNTTTTKQRSGSGKLVFWLVLAALGVSGLGAGGNYLFQSAQAKQDDQAWQSALINGTQSAVRGYVSTWPHGAHASEAKAELSLFNKPWNNFYGNAWGHAASAVATGEDGSIWVASNSVNQSELPDQGWLLRLAATGRIIWSRTIDQDIGNQIWALTPDANGGVVIAGTIAESDDTQTDVFIARYDAQGDTVWQRKIDRAGNQSAAAITRGPDGDYIVGGASTRAGSMQNDGWLARVNDRGELLWEKTQGNLWDDQITAVSMLNDGTIVAAGRSQNGEVASPNFWVLKFDGNGEVLLNRNPGGAGQDSFSSTLARADGSVLLAGDTSSFGTNSSDAIVTILTADNKLPPKVFPAPGDTYVTSIAGDPSGQVIIGGYTSSDGTTGTTAWAMKLAADAKTLVWERQYGVSDRDKITAIGVIPGGSIVLAGTAGFAGESKGGLWVAHTDQSGKIAINLANQKILD